MPIENLLSVSRPLKLYQYSSVLKVVMEMFVQSMNKREKKMFHILKANLKIGTTSHYVRPLGPYYMALGRF